MREGFNSYIDLVVVIFLMMIGITSIINANTIIEDRCDNIVIEDKTAIQNYSGVVQGLHAYSKNDIILMSLIQDEYQPITKRIMVATDATQTTHLENSFKDNTHNNTVFYINNSKPESVDMNAYYSLEDKSVWWESAYSGGSSNKEALQTILNSTSKTLYTLDSQYVKNTVGTVEKGAYVWLLKPAQ